MTVSTTESRISFAGNGVTVLFPIPFPFIDDEYLAVTRINTLTLVETALTLNSGGANGFTVLGAGDATGSVTVVTPPSAIETLQVIRVVPATQESDFVANDPFPAETFEDALDKLTMLIQQGLSALTVGGAFVLKAGDTMTGALVMEDGAFSTTIDQSPDGTFNINPGTTDQIVVINGNTAAGPSTTGQLITGRFRCAMPIEVRNSSVVVASGFAGVASALVRVSNASPVTLTVRENNGTVGQDFQTGNYFSVFQEGAAQVTLAPASANVVLRVPAALAAKTREQYSVITATLVNITGAVQTWVLSGDLEPL